MMIKELEHKILGLSSYFLIGTHREALVTLTALDAERDPFFGGSAHFQAYRNIAMVQAHRLISSM